MASIRSRQGSASLASALRTSRLGVAAIAATVVTFLAAAPAMASDVSVGSNRELSFQAAVGVANALTISGNDPVTVADTADPITPGNGCTAVDANTVTCAGVNQITVNARDKDDVVTILSGFTSLVYGQDGDDTLNGGPGVDLLRGRAGNDTLNGNDGNDVLTGDTGNDVMSGGNGADRADYATSSGGTIDLRTTGPQDTGAGVDTLTGIENVYGSTTGPDFLIGDAAPNIFVGSGGNDVFHTEGGGSDFVNCGADTDQVFPDRSDVVRGPCETIDDGLPVDTSITKGPSGPTNNPEWHFTADEPWARFECAVLPPGTTPSGSTTWDPCTSPKSLAPLSEGSSGVFAVRAVDDQAPDATPETRPFTIDTTPPDHSRIDSGPSGGAVTTDPTPEFFFSSANPETVGFVCRFDNQNWFICSSPLTSDPLADGTHTFEAAATDAAGNFDQTPASVDFRVDTGGPGPGPGDGPLPNPQSPPVQQAKIIIGSLVLISGNTVRMSRDGRVRISLTCAGAMKCGGRLSITTAEPVSKRNRKLVTLGAKRFTIGANKTRKINVRFSKPRIRLVRKLKRFKAKAVIREIDARGNPRISSRIFVLRAR